MALSSGFSIAASGFKQNLARQDGGELFNIAIRERRVCPSRVGEFRVVGIVVGWILAARALQGAAVEQKDRPVRMLENFPGRIVGKKLESNYSGAHPRRAGT